MQLCLLLFEVASILFLKCLVDVLPYIYVCSYSRNLANLGLKVILPLEIGQLAYMHSLLAKSLKVRSMYVEEAHDLRLLSYRFRHIRLNVA
jgi:hypothetical protein